VESLEKVGRNRSKSPSPTKGFLALQGTIGLSSQPMNARVGARVFIAPINFFTGGVDLWCLFGAVFPPKNDKLAVIIRVEVFEEVF
jgi:hypothetical protein